MTILRMRCAAVLAALVFAVAAAAPIAQHETAGDIEDGGRVYRDTCANCHGPDGDEIAGIDLGRGRFRRASTDEDLVNIIRNGVPGTPMPASNFSPEQAARVVAYLRSVAASKRTASTSGDPARGRAVFEGKGACTTCHRVDDNGSRVGPDLTDIGQLRRAIELERSIVDPGAEVLPTNRFYRVVAADGTTVAGRLLNIDTFTIQLIDTNQQLRSFVKAGLREHGFVEGSPMPSYRDRLTPAELADVVSYLVSLKGRVTP